MRNTIVAFIVGAIAASALVVLIMRRGPAETPSVQQALVETPAPAPAQPELEPTPESSSAPEPASKVQKPSPMPESAVIDTPRQRPSSRTRQPRTSSQQEAKPAEKAEPSTEETRPADGGPVSLPSPPRIESAASTQPVVPPAEPLPPPKPNTVTIPAGTLLTVRMGQTVSSERETNGDAFGATLDQPLVVDGFVIAERGSKVEGRVLDAQRAGKVKGASSISVHLVSLKTSDGQVIALDTQPFAKQGDKSTTNDAAKIGAAAAIGAAIGAGVGAGAGTGGVLATRGKAVEIPVETRLTFKLNEPVTVTEKID